MRVAFLASHKDREQELAQAFAAGAAVHGACVAIWPNDQPIVPGCFDAVAMVGVKSAEQFAAVKAAGAIPVMFDKGYVRSRRPDARTWTYWRVSVGAHHPTKTTLMLRSFAADRFDALGLEVAPWRSRGETIVIAGSSAKYHSFYGLPDPTEWVRTLVKQLREFTNRRIIYRPKPSWREAVPVRGTTFSPPTETLGQLLEFAHVLVTHGSNACFEAALAGVPSIVLGDAVAAPISSRWPGDVERPKCKQRAQWLANLAYHQWTEPEMQSGLLWPILEEWIRDLQSV